MNTDSSKYPKWDTKRIEVTEEDHLEFEYKYVIKGKGTFTWEQGLNRRALLSKAAVKLIDQGFGLT